MNTLLPLLVSASGGNRLWTTIISLVVIVLIVYFLLIRPQRKRQKQQKDLLGSMKKGDSVVTIGGVRGKIKSVKEKEVVIETTPGVQLTFIKSAISQVIPSSSEEVDHKEKNSSEDKNSSSDTSK